MGIKAKNKLWGFVKILPIAIISTWTVVLFIGDSIPIMSGLIRLVDPNSKQGTNAMNEYTPQLLAIIFIVILLISLGVVGVIQIYNIFKGKIVGEIRNDNSNQSIETRITELEKTVSKLPRERTDMRDN